MKCNLVYLDVLNKPKFVEGLERFRFDDKFFVYEDKQMHNVYIPYHRIVKVVMLDTQWIL
jgi:uncharacterized protein (UPF0248 family)